jgi:hypothetical protein
MIDVSDEEYTNINKWWGSEHLSHPKIRNKKNSK